MASFTRRMQRMVKRTEHKNPYNFGSKLGVHDPKAADLVAREERTRKHKSRG